MTANPSTATGARATFRGVGVALVTVVTFAIGATLFWRTAWSLSTGHIWSAIYWLMMATSLGGLLIIDAARGRNIVIADRDPVRDPSSGRFRDGDSFT